MNAGKSFKLLPSVYSRNLCVPFVLDWLGRWVFQQDKN